ncbi:unnamed protein product [Durusdinium trenchii]|uniref:Uncharacterized protein n=1 Tax=Durusdinium trenchii TaxID=1381693 RepID=A0ABP0IQX2_9DINO
MRCPPVDRRGIDKASVRFAAGEAAAAAKEACDAGQVFLQGMMVKANWRSGGSLPETVAIATDDGT